MLHVCQMLKLLWLNWCLRATFAKNIALNRSLYLAVFCDSLFIEGLHKEPRDTWIRLRNKCLHIIRFESLSDGSASYSVFVELPQTVLIAESEYERRPLRLMIHDAYISISMSMTDINCIYSFAPNWINLRRLTKRGLVRDTRMLPRVDI